MLVSPQRGHVTGKALAHQETKEDQDYQILQIHFHWGKEVCDSVGETYCDSSFLGTKVLGATKQYIFLRVYLHCQNI